MATRAKASGRTRLSAEDRRNQLLAIGVELLVAEPLENLTAERVALHAGVSRALVFHYFPSVRDLHLACLASAAAELARAVIEATCGGDDAGRLERGLGAFVDYVSQQPNTFMSMSNHAASDPDFGEIFETFRIQMAALINEGMATELDELGTLLTLGWVALVESTVVRWLAGSGVSRAQLIQNLVEVIRSISDQWQRSRTLPPS